MFTCVCVWVGGFMCTTCVEVPEERVSRSLELEV